MFRPRSQTQAPLLGLRVASKFGGTQVTRGEKDAAQRARGGRRGAEPGGVRVVPHLSVAGSHGDPLEGRAGAPVVTPRLPHPRFPREPSRWVADPPTMAGL